MPLSRRVARFNERVTNRLARPVARHAPGFGVVVHTGRTSGRVYRTPVNVFVQNGRFVFALTYGRHAAWVENVLAAGGCRLVTRGREHQLVDPEIVHDDALAPVPTLVRPALRLLHVADFLLLRDSWRQDWVASPLWAST
ncbi:MAG: nitroreductase family deazaflavin-dependent oxidoreductase [Verrucomicrobiota bacterium]